MRSRVFRLGTHQSCAYTTADNTITNAFGTGTNVVRVVATTACYFSLDNTTTATANSVYIAANKPEYFVVTPGMKASAIRVATNGTLHITEVSG